MKGLPLRSRDSVQYIFIRTPRRICAWRPRMTQAAQPFFEEVEIQGHIIDSLLLPKVLDEILTHGGSYVIKDIRIGQKPGRPQLRPHRGARRHARRCCAASSTAIHDHGAVLDHAARLHDRGRPTWTGPFPRASTAPPTTARRFASAATGSTSRTRRWIAASSSTRKAAAARCLPMTDVRTRRPHRRRPAGAARLPGRDAGPAQSVRVHGQPRLQREAQGRDRPRDRRRHEAHPGGGREDPGRPRPGRGPHRQRRAHLRS